MQSSRSFVLGPNEQLTLLSGTQAPEAVIKQLSLISEEMGFDVAAEVLVVGTVSSINDGSLKGFYNLLKHLDYGDNEIYAVAHRLYSIGKEQKSVEMAQAAACIANQLVAQIDSNFDNEKEFKKETMSTVMGNAFFLIGYFLIEQGDETFINTASMYIEQAAQLKNWDAIQFIQEAQKEVKSHHAFFKSKELLSEHASAAVTLKIN